jgi:glycosyltransferase involved in cell wall biosynthesis
VSKAPHVVLLTTFHEPCGIATYSEALTAALDALGTRISVLAPHLRRGTQARGSEVPRLWSRSAGTPLEARRVFREIERLGPDLVHVQHNLGLFSSPFLWQLSRLLERRGTPLLVTLHGRTGGSLLRRLRYARALYATKSATLLVHNRGHAAELTRPSVVIAHGIPEVKPGDQAAARRSLGIAPSQRLLAHFGFIHPDKGIREMLLSVSELSKEFPSLRYRVSGAPFANKESQAYFASLRELVAERGLEGIVHMPGRFLSNEELALELGAADWIVLNYKTGGSEGTSGAVRHALAPGRPVAVSPAPIFEDLGDAVHVLSRDLTGSLRRLITERELEAGTLARQLRYCEENAWPRVAERHVELFERLIAK